MVNDPVLFILVESSFLFQILSAERSGMSKKLELD